MPGEDRAGQRPRRWLLVALGVAALALLVYWTWPSASPGPSPSNQARDPRGRPPAAQTQAPALRGRLDDLAHARPQPNGAERNPFRFQPKAPPPPPPSSVRPPPVTTAPPPPVAPPQPVGPPPIPLKYFGIVEGRPGRIAALTDGRDVYHGREGDVIDGRYRIVKIGVESITMEYVDGRGRQTIPFRGQ